MFTTRAQAQHGFTLIEVMVSITVGLILLSGVLSIFISNKTAYRLQESTNVLDENARYALDQIQYHLRLGDHWGGVEAADIDVDGPLAALPIASQCTESRVISTVGFYGIEGSPTTPLDCIPNGDYKPNTDILIVRYAEPERSFEPPLAGHPTVSAGEIYLHAHVGFAGRLFKGNALSSLPSDVFAPASVAEPTKPTDHANYRFMTAIYFIRRCASQDHGNPNLCDADDDTTPTLARLVLQGTDLVQEDVVAGVEQLQARYGKLTSSSPPDIQYYDATTVGANNDWPRIVNVQVSLVLRGSEFDVTHSDERSFDLYGGYTFHPATADQHFSRKQFNFAVQIRNLTRG